MFAALFTVTLFVALFQRVFADLSIDTPQFTQVSGGVVPCFRF